MQVRMYCTGSLGLRVVLLADLHNGDYAQIIRQVETLEPDIIAVAGDITHQYDCCDRAQGFLSCCSDLAATFVSLGNHDSVDKADFLGGVTTSGAVLLDNCYVDVQAKGTALRIGGLSSHSSYLPKEVRKSLTEGRSAWRHKEPDTAWLPDFCGCAGYKILLSHQPEFYPRYLWDLPIDLVLSGHAHGGQWRIGNQGVYAPGQGLFPKLTGGVIDGRADRKLVISRGLSNPLRIPRFFNPREIVVIDI